MFFQADVIADKNQVPVFLSIAGRNICNQVWEIDHVHEHKNWNPFYFYTS